MKVIFSNKVFWKNFWQRESKRRLVSHKELERCISKKYIEKLRSILLHLFCWVVVLEIPNISQKTSLLLRPTSWRNIDFITLLLPYNVMQTLKNLHLNTNKNKRKNCENRKGGAKKKKKKKSAYNSHHHISK